MNILTQISVFIYLASALCYIIAMLTVLKRDKKDLKKMAESNKRLNDAYIEILGEREKLEEIIENKTNYCENCKSMLKLKK